MISQPKKPKYNPILTTVILVSLGIHVLALLVFGSITLVKMVLPTEAEFEEPPAIEEVQPPPEVKVEIKPQAAPQEQAMKNLRMKQVGNIAVAAVDVNLPSMEQSFTVSSGLGSFSGGAGLLGNARGSIGLGVSDVNVFGLKSRAERFLFVIDASKSMLVDEKGGLHSYRVIKDEIGTMVKNLSVGTLFNVAFYNNGRLLFFKPQPVPAGVEVAEELKTWIAPINEDINSLGIPGSERVPLKTLQEHPVHQAIQSHQHRNTNELIYLTQAFLEQSIDAVYFITGSHPGFGKVERNLTPEELEDWNKKTSDPRYQEALKAHEAERTEATRKAKEKLKKLNEERAKQGIPPKVIDGSIIGAMGIKFENPHPGYRPSYFIPQDDVEHYVDEVIEILYENKGGTPPSMNVILFLAGDETFSESSEESLKDYVRFFSGKHRIIRGLNEIKMAASAAESKN